MPGLVKDHLKWEIPAAYHNPNHKDNENKPTFCYVFFNEISEYWKNQYQN